MDDRQAYEQWQKERLTYVTAPTGNLALVNYHPVTGEPTDVPDLPLTVRTAPGEEGVTVTADPSAGVTVDGEPVHGEHFMGRLGPDGAPLLRWERFAVDAFSLDGSDYELRIYDSESPGLANFKAIECYPYDPELVLTGTYTRLPEADKVPWDFTRESDAGHRKTVPGSIAVTVDDQAYELLAFQDGPNLVLVFADGTTGTESYAPGRFLRMDLPDDTGSVTVDFNRTFVPPCGFSDFYSCPVPPPQNRIKAPVRAGEQRVTWHRPRY